MPKVMIEGMEMPKSCGECRFYFDDNRMGVNYCALTAEETYYHLDRPSWCPLQEVKCNKWSEGYDAGMKRAYEQMLETKEKSVKE